MTSQSLTAELVAWAGDVTWSTLPAGVREATVCRVVDSLGLMLAGSATPSGAAVRDFALDQGGRPGATIVGTSHRLPVALTALVHGTWVHVHDFDDTEPNSVVHPTGPIAATAIAVGEEAERTADEVLAAIAVGVETMCRLGAPAGRRFHNRGFHATGVVGPISAALTATTLMNCDEKTSIDALGLAGSMSSGLLAFLSDGTWSKRLHPGWAAHGGVTAAGLARHGFRGPSAILEDRYGTYASFLHGESVDPGETVRDLGTTWISVPPHVKRYPCAHVIQPFLDIVLGTGLRAASVDQLELRVPRWQAPIVCEPWATKTRPATEYQARTSLPFAVALALVDGDVGVDSFGDDALHRHDLHDVLARVRYTIDDALEDFEAVVVVRHRDGATVTHAVPVDEPAPADAVRTKLPSTAGRVLGPELVAELAAGLHRADSQDPFDPVAFVARCVPKGVNHGQ